MTTETSSPNISQLVADFHRLFMLSRPPFPTMGSPKLRAMRLSLIQEEVSELEEALLEGDLVATADALGDLAYVTFGAAIAFGIDLDAIVAEIHRSNMTKLGDDGRPVLDTSGKVRKGPCYEPPRLEPILGWHP